jgi:hypothetical protein
MIVVFSLSIDDLAWRVPRSVERDGLELDAEVFGDELAAGEDRDVFEHRLAAIAEAGSLHRADVDVAAELVDDEGGERFAFDVFRDDQRAACRSWRPSRGSGACPSRLQIFFSWIRMYGVFEDRLHRARRWSRSTGRGSPCRTACLRRRRASVSMRLAFFDGDDAVLADLVHGVGDHACR